MGKLGFDKGKREHRYVAVRLSAYVDDEVSGRERRRIEAHLASCEACRGELRALRWTVGLLRQTPPVKAPRLFAVREADLVNRRQPVQARVPLQATQWATAVVALLFVLVIGVDLLAGGGLRRASTTPVARGEREVVAVTQVVEKEVAVEAAPQEAAPQLAAPQLAAPEGAAEQEADQVARALPDETAPLMPTPAAQVEAEALPAEREGMKAGAPEPTDAALTAMQGEEVGVAEAVTVTGEAAIMLAQPVPSPTPAPAEPGGGGGLPPAATAPPEVERQPEIEAPEPKPNEHALPTPSPVTGEYGLRALVRQDVLLWRVAEAVLGLALVGLLIAVVWMRSRR